MNCQAYVYVCKLCIILPLVECKFSVISLIVHFSYDVMQQMTLIQVQASVKNNMRRLNRRMVQSGSSHILHVVLFALFCLFLVYFWSKFSRH